MRVCCWTLLHCCCRCATQGISVAVTFQTFMSYLYIANVRRCVHVTEHCSATVVATLATYRTGVALGCTVTFLAWVTGPLAHPSTLSAGKRNEDVDDPGYNILCKGTLLQRVISWFQLCGDQETLVQFVRQEMKDQMFIWADSSKDP